MTSINRTLSILLLAVLALALACTEATAFEASVKGASVTITGKAEPDESMRFAASSHMQLPVEAGQYQYETRISVPQKPNRFTVKVQNVQDLNAGVKMGIWLTKRFEASGGMATLSKADIPPGSYSLKIFGQALAGRSTVPVDMRVETEVEADSNGDYSLTIDTTGIPSGEYSIQGAGQTKTINVSQAATSTASSQGGIIDWLGSLF